MNSQVKNWLLVLLTALIFLGTLALYEQWISAKAALLFIFIMVLLFTIVLFTKINNGLLTIIAICISLSLSSCTWKDYTEPSVLCPCVVVGIVKQKDNSDYNGKVLIKSIVQKESYIEFSTLDSTYQLGDTIK